MKEFLQKALALCPAATFTLELQEDTARGARTAGRTDGAAKIRFMNRTFGHIGRKPGFFINFALGNTFAFVL